MIFSFQSSINKSQDDFKEGAIDYSHLIDISLIKLNNLQSMGKSRSEQHILFVLDVLQQALFLKSINDHGESTIILS